MSGEEMALFGTIRNNPDDDTTRLVYADWLDDHGDPRAAWLRAEVESRRVAVPSQRFWELKVERKRLQPANPEWVTAMQYRPCHRPMFTKLPVERGERWRLADEFIELWCTPLTRTDGCSEAELEAAAVRLGLRLPAALREWYVLGSKRLDVWSRQDRLRLPGELCLAEWGLTFRDENQGCMEWYVRTQDLHLDDPPVYQRETAKLSCPRMSAFAQVVLLYEHLCNSDAIVFDLFLDEEDWRCNDGILQQTELHAWYWGHDVVFWEGMDVLVAQFVNPPECDAVAVARTMDAFERVREFAGEGGTHRAMSSTD